MRGVKNKGEYAALETRRFLALHGITRSASNPFFPVNTLQIMRGAVAAQRIRCFERYVDEVYRHMWADPKKDDDADERRKQYEADWNMGGFEMWQLQRPADQPGSECDGS